MRLEGTDYVVVLAGVLDDDPVTKPFRHIFVAQDGAWNLITDDLPCFEERPLADHRIQASVSKQ